MPKSPERDYCELREVGSATWFSPSFPTKIAPLYLSFVGVGSWKQVKYYRVLVLGGRGEIILRLCLKSRLDRDSNPLCRLYYGIDNRLSSDSKDTLDNSKEKLFLKSLAGVHLRRGSFLACVPGFISSIEQMHFPNNAPRNANADQRFIG